MKIAMIQMEIGTDKAENLHKAISFIGEAGKKNADMAILPEMFACPYDAEKFPENAEKEGGDICKVLAKVAKIFNIYVVAGSIPEMDENGHVYNTSFVFDREGKQIAKHRKMHLFDIDVENGQYFKESDSLTAGDCVTVFDTEFGKMGLAICYDIRFPELFRLMVEEGAKAVIVPAAFNMTTGPAHWELAFRSRAVDNQIYTLGVAPARNEQSSYVSYANTIAVDPWGEVIANLGERECYGIVELDFEKEEKIRKELPLLQHLRKDVYAVDLKNCK